jgi:hypothetical protein
MRTKRSYAQEIIEALQNAHRNIDYKTPDERVVFLRMDAIVNELAANSFFANWAMAGSSMDEHYLTRWDGDNAITVIDQEDGLPSYFDFPAEYVDLPRHRGIDEIYPLEQGDYDQSVIIRSHRSVRAYKNNKAGNMQGRLSGYPKGNRFEFCEAEVTKKYGEKFGLSLVIRDSSLISVTAPYPIPADKVRFVIDKAVEYFKDKRAMPDDKIRDNNDNKQ